MINNLNILKKITIIILITLLFTSCYDDQKQKNDFKASLPMPESGNELRKMGIIDLWYDAKKDPIPAMKIGYAYSEELHDYEKALEWYKYADSMIPLGENSYFACYALQKLKRYDEAISWCQKAIDLKWDKALSLIGTIYEDSKDYDSAIKYYKLSFEKLKDGLSANNLGYLYSTKVINYEKAEEWYKKAISQNHYSSYSSFATFYHDDKKDDVKASAYSIALIDTKYTKSSVLKVLQDEWNIPNETIKKGYELQLTSDDFPLKYKGKLNLE
ncbi:tetratricopeptide repeat protein [Halarcobacter anaerophilus]|uniref:tetratricopeptide repeat protein n=1 Tax=Halarcobacter anaerophilus TaxID=877500 RepID=UPI0005CA3C1C|nr:tetratricopeptide repeat protein [Halarcobacter anaerophilus]